MVGRDPAEGFGDGWDWLMVAVDVAEAATRRSCVAGAVAGELGDWDLEQRLRRGSASQSQAAIAVRRSTPGPAIFFILRRERR